MSKIPTEAVPPDRSGSFFPMKVVTVSSPPAPTDSKREAVGVVSIDQRLGDWQLSRQIRFALTRLRRRYRLARRRADNRLHKTSGHSTRGIATYVARLDRFDQRRILLELYRFVRHWQRTGQTQAVKSFLREGANAPFAAKSNLFLILTRSALSTLDIKQASKWAAALRLAQTKGVPADRLFGYLDTQGGIEGKRLPARRPNKSKRLKRTAKTQSARSDHRAVRATE